MRFAIIRSGLLVALACALPIALPSVVAAADATAASAATKDLFDPTAAGVEKQFTAGNQVTIVPGAPGIAVAIAAGPEGYPGIDLAGKWDLSAYGHIAAHITNTGAKAIDLSLRVDNAGDWKTSPWNTESARIEAGKSGTITVLFGYSYGHKRGFALDPKAITNIKIFTGKVGSALSFTVDAIEAGGPAGEHPPIDPASIRLEPKGGVIVGAGAGFAVFVIEGRNAVPWAKACGSEAPPDLSTEAGTGKRLAPVDGAAHLVFSGKGKESAVIRPAHGRWDLREANQVRVKLHNDGAAAVAPSVCVTSDNGVTASATCGDIAAGGDAEVVVPFAAAVPATCVMGPKPTDFKTEPGTGTTFESDRVTGVTVTIEHDATAAITATEVVADAPPATMPDWLGKRPPVDGEWSVTFSDDFGGSGDGTAIDAAKWNIYGPNYWDRASHWTKDDLIVGGGTVTMRFEKKTGFHNDDPKGKPANLSGSNTSPYACGYLDSFGKFRQKYGYFESRLKLPDTPGLWPTFWMMPDRGPEAGEAWKRTDTGNGAMEMDIMEHLTRWGRYRYNTANHWDGYGKEHKAWGSTNNYVQADQDGFITPGLLWLPGEVTYFCNGKPLTRMVGARVSDVPSYFIYETTTGGWDNDSVDDAKLPADYVIDYVRVWQRKDLAEAEAASATAASATPAAGATHAAP